MRICFVHCPDPIYSLSQNYGAKFMPVWAFTLASWIEKHELELFDTQVTNYKKITECDIYLFSGINQDLNHIKEIHQFLKRKFPNKKYIIGGPIAWSLDQAEDLKVLDAFDHICVGDGEIIIPMLITKIEEGEKLNKIIKVRERFKVCESKPMSRYFLKRNIKKYYGGIVEVSRGCPFLCEFCDIRVMSDNNRSHVFLIDHLISEIDYQENLGVRKITLACDNFIGDLNFANNFVEALINWKEKKKSKVSFFTWCTINLYNYPDLMRKMRLAGFDLLFIGIESFNENSLNETAKVQNTSFNLTEAIQKIQSYGFIIIAGFIFGFDSDEEDFALKTLTGLKDSGLISGDPNWLTALPGTPLYLRMKLSGRLRSTWSTHGAFKFQTNIKYLLNKDLLITEFLKFVKIYSSASFQYERYKNFLKQLESDNFIECKSGGFGDPIEFLSNVFSHLTSIKQFLNRFYYLIRNPMNTIIIFKALFLTLKSKNARVLFPYFLFWGFTWTNVMVKYSNLTKKDFDIDSVEDAQKIDLIPKSYETTLFEPISENKIKAQRKRTIEQLGKIKKVNNL